ncbi:hypothetical protein FJ977_04370 [Mesorhizobium sp. B2-1-3A]|nr:hypothetical protein FJ977_04370 [Mesorhizobium sp. B2-1-3A]
MSLTFATFEISRGLPDFVILGRSKERSDAAQTLGSMPRHQGVENGTEFCAAAPYDRVHGMDPRVFTTELRSCFALG